MAGRWYPGVDTERLRRQALKLRKLEAMALQAARPQVCKTCGNPLQPVAAEDSYFPCCSEACHDLWLVELERRDEVKEARRLGISVAVFRKNKISTDRDGEK